MRFRGYSFKIMAQPFNPTKGFALLIAVNESKIERWALKDVLNDAQQLEKVLLAPSRCGYARDNVRLVSGTAASEAGIKDGLAWLQEKVETEPDATAIVYYTGHGDMRDGVSYLVPYNVNDKNFAGTALRADVFAAAVQAIAPKRMLIVLDCCHAEGMRAKDLSLPAPQPVPLALFKAAIATASDESKGLGALEQGEGRYVINSCQTDELSWLYEDRKMSAFTYHLIEALTGHYRPTPGATDVLVSEVISYLLRTVPDQVTQRLNKQQHPEPEGRGSFAIAKLPGGKPWTKDTQAPDVMAPLAAAGGATFNNQIGSVGTLVQGETVTIGSFNPINNMGAQTTINASSGANVAVGNSAAVTQSSITHTREDLAGVFTALSSALAALPASTERADAEATVAAAATELAKPQPLGSRVINRLKELQELAAGAAGAGAALATLAPLVTRGLELAGQLFR